MLTLVGLDKLDYSIDKINLIIAYSNGRCYNGWGMMRYCTMVGVRVAMQGVVWHGSNMILLLLLGAHAARKRLINTKVIRVLIAIL